MLGVHVILYWQQAVYIGASASTGYSRVRQQECLLRTGKSRHPELQELYDECPEAFRIEWLVTGTPEEVAALEKEYIHLFEPLANEVYTGRRGDRIREWWSIPENRNKAMISQAVANARGRRSRSPMDLEEKRQRSQSRKDWWAVPENREMMLKSRGIQVVSY